MHKKMEIKSHKGIYSVQFSENAFAEVAQLSPQKTQIIIDQNVLQLYSDFIQAHLSSFPLLVIEANEENKNIKMIDQYVDQLMNHSVKIDHTLVAIGGGIIQDLTCFLASNLFRGMKWIFVPTTLLAQADSCIGSKSSINVGPYKNLMGGFCPPEKIIIDLKFLNTLSDQEIRSGIGEILKVHMIKGLSEFRESCDSYERMLTERSVLEEFIWRSLSYKRELIEIDEFDRGPRNVMNYGHSYGHAIESATHFGIPHGIAVTIGMDMANHQSYQMGRISKDDFLSWHQTLRKNFRSFRNVALDPQLFFQSIQRDKKNIGGDLMLILVRSDGPIEKVRVLNDEKFKTHCLKYFETYFRRSDHEDHTCDSNQGSAKGHTKSF